MYGDGGATTLVKVRKDIGTLDALAAHAAENVPALVEGVGEALTPWAEA